MAATALLLGVPLALGCAGVAWLLADRPPTLGALGLVASGTGWSGHVEGREVSVRPRADDPAVLRVRVAVPELPFGLRLGPFGADPELRPLGDDRFDLALRSGGDPLAVAWLDHEVRAALLALRRPEIRARGLEADLAGPDVEAIRALARLAGRLGGREPTAALRAIAEHDPVLEVRAHAGRLLGPLARPPLDPGATDRAASTAAEALASLSPPVVAAFVAAATPEARRTLFGLLGPRTDAAVRIAALRALAGVPHDLATFRVALDAAFAAPSPAVLEATVALARALRRRSDAVVDLTVERMIALGPAPGVEDGLARLVGDAVRARSVGLAWLGAHGTPASLPALRALAGEGSTRDEVAAADALRAVRARHESAGALSFADPGGGGLSAPADDGRLSAPAGPPRG